MTGPDLRGQSVWVVAKGYAPDEGGMQTYAQGVAEGWAATGATVTVFTQTSAGPRRETVGPILLVDVGASKSARVALRFLRAIRRELRASGPPRLIHGTTWRTSVLPLLMGLPYLTTFHGREFMYPRGAVLALMRQVARRARLCVTVSHYSAGRLRARLGPRTKPALVAWNGLSLWDRPTPSASRDHEVPLIVSLCRLERRKNIVACVDACAEIRARGFRFRYVIAGRGPERARVAAAVDRHGLGDCVSVVGFVAAERAARLYAEADIFLHPQIADDRGRDFEGFGIAIADAMAAGGAVIVGAEGGAAELVPDESHGLVVDGRSTEAIASALEALLKDPARRGALAQAGLRYAAGHFSWRRHVASIRSALDPGG